MTHNRHDITNVHIGQYGEIDIAVEDGDGNAIDMSSGDARFAVMPLADRDRALADAGLVVDKSLGSGVTAIDAGAGELRVTLDPSDTDGLTPAPYWYRVTVTDSNGDPVPGAVAGQFELSYD